MSKISAIILGFFFVVGSFIVVFGASKAIVDIKSMERSVVVKGLSEKEVLADVMIFPINFTRASNDLNVLYQELENDSKKIIEFLQKIGIQAEEITIEAPKITDKVGSAYGESQSIVYRYSGEGRVLVYTNKVDLGRRALEKLTELGKEGTVVRVDDYEIEYLYTKLNEVKPEMVEEATFNAREVAQKFAQDSQSTLGKIKKASQGQFSVSNRDRNTPHIKKVRVVSTIEYYFQD